MLSERQAPSPPADEGASSVRPVPERQSSEPGLRQFTGVRARALISFMVLLVVATAASLLVLRAVLLSRIDDEIDTQLSAQVDQLAALSDQPAVREQGVTQLFDAYLQRVPPLADGALVTLVSNERYRSLTGSLAVPELATVALEQVGGVTKPRSGELIAGGEEARFVAVPAQVGVTRGTLIAVGGLGEQRAQVADAIRIAVGVSIVVMALASLLIWLAAGRTVAPLTALARAARSVTETDLSRRIPVKGRDEIAELGRTFNGMLDRLEVGFANQKEFLTDVSHELRTPITVIRGYLETLGEDPAEREEAIAVVQDELDRMNRLVDDLLLLAKASRPDFLMPEPVDLDLFTHDLFAKARSLGQRNWRLDGTGVGVVRVDPHRLTQAAMNLADNAVRHTGPDQEIAIGSSLIGGQARLWVRDQGPGIQPALRERIFDRHVRARPGWTGHESDGSGIGLAIVRAVAEAHGGSVLLDSSPGSGATFTIAIPAVEAAAVNGASA